MAVYKILDDFYEPTFSVIAIHSYLEDYRLAYLLNLHLQSKLKRLHVNIDFKDKTSFSVYEWEDEYQHTVWNLISNKFHTESDVIEIKGENLFSLNNTTMTHFLIPERNRIDYFLKIDNGTTVPDLKKIVAKINMIGQVSTAYHLNIESLKSRNNLIF
jgi:hypothetical protein